MVDSELFTIDESNRHFTIDITLLLKIYRLLKENKKSSHKS